MSRSFTAHLTGRCPITPRLTVIEQTRVAVLIEPLLLFCTARTLVFWVVEEGLAAEANAAALRGMQGAPRAAIDAAEKEAPGLCSRV
jgi:hypothetical protein